ncbi:hypothetical protein SAMN05421788_106122 [Filimonas lacunae]|uniref:Uncharacterized protein n=1 Tax=Filimonas lacunae TaxID=477680 RepID=A0A173MEM3_9BACT|nr:hypothetical protein [Filimonas lacunae]BAV06053.1 hypothetical protein FLA_2068 [Filimonas lacunae]SIT24428.1 hypothetical protein SAMN05421788_106122 [Filimonas lacunae]
MINYSTHVFKVVKAHNNKEVYAWLHPEVDISKQEYAVTGRYLVVLLHPDKGLQTFYLNKEKGSEAYVMDENSPAIVEEEWQEWCSKAIHSHARQQQSSL